ncbi:MAG: hypothetical protein BWY29_00834 [Microgenomates group bacterium ADurb.Bin238]|nr:MAG: hypothetical protein BWY29_00834 [Microgenomates group bacterium ADurb.Bin238]
MTVLLARVMVPELLMVNLGVPEAEAVKMGPEFSWLTMKADLPPAKASMVV